MSASLVAASDTLWQTIGQVGLFGAGAVLVAGLVGARVTIGILTTPRYWLERGDAGIARLGQAARTGHAVIGRLGAIQVLGELEDSRALHPLLDLLKDEDPIIRAAAVRALGTLGDVQAIPALQRLAVEDVGVDEYRRSVRERATVALTQLDQLMASADEDLP